MKKDLIIMIRKTFLIFCLYILAISPLIAQSYITTLGLRVGDNDNFRMAGISFQQQIFNKVTLEGILQSDFTKNTTLHLLAEGHQNIIAKRLNLYVGIGIMGGYEEFSQKTKPSEQNKTLGADLVAGLEVTLLHWNFSIDYKPNFNIYGRELWYQGQVGISARAVLISDSALQKHKREKAREQRQKEREKAKEKREKEREKENNQKLKDQGKEQQEPVEKNEEKSSFEEKIKELLK
jgi:hypothetical protein